MGNHHAQRLKFLDCRHLAALVFLVAPFLLHAQQLVVQVRDSLSVPDFASVYLLDASQQIVWCEKNPGIDGIVTFPETCFKADTATLLVEAFGYQGFRKVCLRPSTSLQADTLLVLLKPWSFALTEVEVLGKPKLAAIENNVREELNLRGRDSTERSVADLLERDSNVRVLPNGLLQYRGSAVSRVLIDGKDLFGANQYGDAISRLPAHLVARVEAIENYHEDVVLAMLEPSSETVLDLQSADPNQKQLYGNMLSSQGSTVKAQYRYQNEAALLLNQQKLSSYLNGTYSRLASTTVPNFDRRIQISRKNRSVEPIGETYTQIPRPFSDWTNLEVFDTDGLIGDASIANAELKLLLNGKDAAKTQISVGFANREDKAQLSSTLRTEGRNAFLLATERQSITANEQFRWQLRHSNNSPNRKNSWLLVARQDLNSDQSRSGIVQRTSLSGQQFPFAQESDWQPWYLEARFNRLLNPRSALQLYA